MNWTLAWSRAGLQLALCVALSPAAAQTKHETAQKLLDQNMPAGTVQACTLISRADVRKASGRDPYVEAEAAGQGGWICNVGTAELKVYSGSNSWDTWESNLKAFKKDKEPRTPAPGFGPHAYLLFPKPDHKSSGNVAILVAKSGTHTLALSLDAPEGQPAESVRPALESLMKLVLSRLPG